jgi:hypothetical protein
MRFIPVQLGYPDAAGPQSNPSNSFQLSPSTLPVTLLQISQVADRGVHGNDLDIVNGLKNLEVHGRPEAVSLPMNLLELKRTGRKGRGKVGKEVREIRDFIRW